MKKILFPLILLITGAAIGAGGGYATTLFLAPPAGATGKPEPAEEEPGTFVTVPQMTAPLVLKDGKLSGYAKFEIQLEVSESDAAAVTARLPFLQHAINLRTFKVPMAAGADGMLPDLDNFRRVVIEAAREAIGPDKVRKVTITKAEPA
ncbi:hypothetical protein J2Y54_002996 [Sphingomonas sp. BE123]|jgi:hypothetical protein|uniref:flagellar basal body-associated FliL family protein n=1 Tax=unclassified Sphingomonas TaxID=196159 RepID=UPI0028614D73|nr:flagellar basal body-associated FliL family protein [Sphingomonas sp. BE123]MDR6853476.1 hypothetical protein [Sphingomonas sp. BE123]